MIQYIKSLIKMARMVSSDDTGNYRSGQFFYQGQTSKGQIFTPYGFIHNPPDNSLAILFSQNGQDSNTIAIVSDPKNRKKNLAKGEAGVENQLTSAYILFDEDGDVEINTPVRDINVTAAQDVNVTATRDVAITAGRDVTVSAGRNVTITAADDITIAGDNLTFNITGNSIFNIGGTTITINSGGITVSGGDVIADGVSLKTHVHSDVQSGSSNTGVPV